MNKSLGSATAQPGSVQFEKDVHAVACLIPAGRVTSYGAIARCLGASRSSRMVGWAMNRALLLEGEVPAVPAHRVVNRLGVLSGRMHFPTPTTMAERLVAEGIRVETDKVVDFDAHFWDPSTEL